MYSKSFKGLYYSAYTLDGKEVCSCSNSGFGHQCERIHDDGWIISGYIKEDYYTWVNEFEATHPIFGEVFGDFEDVVYADSQEGFDDFFSKHTPVEWYFEDI